LPSERIVRVGLIVNDPVRGQEGDGGGARTWPLAYQARRLEAVQAALLDVQQDQGELLAQEQQQRFLAGGGGDQVGVALGQRHAQGKQDGRIQACRFPRCCRWSNDRQRPPCAVHFLRPSAHLAHAFPRAALRSGGRCPDAH
jgi:hypothetical protein